MKNFTRSSGVLMHISSLPSEFGIGDFGPQARTLIDQLAEAGQSYWQILPLNPTLSVCGHSPYSSTSAYAANYLFLSPQELLKDRLLKDDELEQFKIKSKRFVDFSEVQPMKSRLIDLVVERFRQSSELNEEFESFCVLNRHWLNDYALFKALKDRFKGAVWKDWPEKIAHRDPDELNTLHEQCAQAVMDEQIVQFLLLRQWQSLSEYAASKKVKIFGDIPIYVQYDSADVWQNPEIFKLNDQLKMEVVSGVPPDYFSETGQRWGNPVYNWDGNKSGCLDWWMNRLNHNLNYFDLIRIDHFRGLVQYWAIPESEETAINGEWCDVPVHDFMNCLLNRFPHIEMVAEDLGIITDDVKEVMAEFEIPGMKILQFAFNGDLVKHPYLPHNIKEHDVVYTGTHDNNTIVGWFENDATKKELETLDEYIDNDFDSKKIHWLFIEMAMTSDAWLSIIPWQDIFGLDGKCRMNTPSTIHENWTWRWDDSQFKKADLKKLFNLTKKNDRLV